MATAAQKAMLFLERRVSSLMIVTSSRFAVPCFRMLYQAGSVGLVTEAGGMPHEPLFRLPTVLKLGAHTAGLKWAIDGYFRSQ